MSAALGEAYGLRYLDALAAEDLTERGGERRVVIVNQKAQRQLAVIAPAGEVACLLGDPGSAGILGGAGEVNAAAVKLDEEEP